MVKKATIINQVKKYNKTEKKKGISIEDKIRTEVYSFFHPLKMNATVQDLGEVIIVEPHTRQTGPLKAGQLDGMQILYFVKEKMFEVSESQAGPKQNNLYIYKETKSLKAALKDILKGNNRKPIKTW